MHGVYHAGLIQALQNPIQPLYLFHTFRNGLELNEKHRSDEIEGNCLRSGLRNPFDIFHPFHPCQISFLEAAHDSLGLRQAGVSHCVSCVVFWFYVFPGRSLHEAAQDSLGQI